MRKTLGILLIVMLALYIVSPIDVIPDMVPFPGLLDDAVALLLFIRQISELKDPVIGE